MLKTIVLPVIAAGAVTAIISALTGWSISFAALILLVLYAAVREFTGLAGDGQTIASGRRPIDLKFARNNSASIDARKQKMLALLRGDRKTAQRLLNQCRREHPGRDDAWCLDKIIYDLQRDRH